MEDKLFSLNVLPSENKDYYNYYYVFFWEWFLRGLNCIFSCHPVTL